MSAEPLTRESIETRVRHILGRSNLGCDITDDEKIIYLAAEGGAISPPIGTVEGLSDGERQADPALAVGLTWSERVALYEEQSQAERDLHASVVSERDALARRVEALERRVRHYHLHPADLLTEIRDAALSADDEAAR